MTRTTAAESGVAPGGEVRHILVSQCLQNDFFLNEECRLVLHDRQVLQLLAAGNDHAKLRVADGRRRLDEKVLERGPLGLFLKATVGAALAGGRGHELHVVNIRDWHDRDESYDDERRVVGRHCERNTWGARYLDGLTRYLDPEPPLADGRARACIRNRARIYHVHADSLFDFRPRWNERLASRVATPGGAQPRFKHGRSELEALLDVLIAGHAAQVSALERTLAAARDHDSYLAALQEAADEVDESDPGERAARVYVAVIGVYTDVKVQILLGALRSRYELPNLAVSDSLTQSQSLERHLSGLDFSDKVLKVEIIHGIGDLACFLGFEPPDGAADVVGGDDFSQYRTYFMDKQNVLAYVNDKLLEYSDLAAERSVRLYEAIRKANMFLIWSGAGFLALTAAGAVLHFVDPSRWSWELPVASGGLGVAELVTVFFAPAIRGLQRNLTNLVSLKMILERHTLKSAITQYHLTTPEVLRELHNEDEAARSQAQVDALAAQLRAIDASHLSDYEALTRIVAFSFDDATASGVPGGGAPAAASNGAAAPADAPATADQLDQELEQQADGFLELVRRRLYGALLR